jgi:hypothetical protein
MSGANPKKTLAIVVATTMAVIGGLMAYRALHDQASGVAVYWAGYDMARREEVSRATHPVEFRSILRADWEVSVFCFTIAGLGFSILLRSQSETTFHSLVSPLA